VVKRDYDRSVFVESVLPLNYEDPNFANHGITLSESTKMFLENLCGGNPYFYNVLRGFCRILLTARAEGTCFQTCVWVSGPPATMKSTWPNVIKLLVKPNRIQEQSKIITPFTAGQLEACDLLILSDVQTISKEVVGLLKAIVGRDTITLQKKYEQDIKCISPYCQVIIINNYPPSHFPEVSGDEPYYSRRI
jgi:phage/plasmid-associated DNA primase